MIGVIIHPGRDVQSGRDVQTRGTASSEMKICALPVVGVQWMNTDGGTICMGNMVQDSSVGLPVG